MHGDKATNVARDFDDNEGKVANGAMMNDCKGSYQTHNRRGALTHGNDDIRGQA